MGIVNFNHYLSTLTPELRFLIQIFHTSNSGTDSLKRPNAFSFDKFLRTIGRHEVFLPLSHRLNLLELSLEKKEFDKLKNVIQVFSMKQLKLSGELFQLLRQFQRHNIPVIPLKGPILSQTLYGSLASRESADIDILIRPVDLEKANQLFQEIDYLPKDFKLDRFSEKQWAVLKSIHCNLGYSPKGRGITEVELHWKMFEATELYYKDVERLIQASALTEIQGVSVRSMKKEDLFVYLAIHGAKHRWAGLKWLLDIRQFILNFDDQIDWGELLIECRQKHIHWPVIQALYLSHGLFGTLLPKSVSQAVHQEQGIKTLVNDALNNIAKETFRDNNWTHTVNIIKLKPGWKHTKFYINRLLYAPQDWGTLKLPDFLFFLYFPMRPFLMLYRKFSGKTLM